VLCLDLVLDFTEDKWTLGLFFPLATVVSPILMLFWVKEKMEILFLKNFHLGLWAFLFRRETGSHIQFPSYIKLVFKLDNILV
jgi:hypothetical protein